MRAPVVAGQFYELDSKALRDGIRKCFDKAKPVPYQKGLLAVISPHAGYFFSGIAAAHSFKAIAAAEKPDVYLIIGPSHSGSNTSISIEDWETPLGVAKVDREFGNALSKLVTIDNHAHTMEHSIEVQLPFLQYVQSDFRFLPLMVSYDISYKEIASAIRKAVLLTKKRIIIVASSDFTHYGPNYGYLPFTENVKEQMYSLDNGAISAIKSLKPEQFASYLKKTGATICGAQAIAVLMETIHAKSAELLSYYTSGDVVGDYRNAVGYASLAFY